MSRSCLPALLGLLFTTGCLDPRLRCGEQTPSGACISVLGVAPTHNGEATANVDVVRGKCGDPSQPTKQTAEPFRDHDAVITIVNQGVSAQDPPELGPAIIIDSYEVTFSVNTQCSGGCPDLDPLTGLQTFTVTGGKEVSHSLPLMPLATKKQFLDRNGDADQVPSYSAVYKLSGTDPVGKFSIEAATSFTIGNFDYCPNAN